MESLQLQDIHLPESASIWPLALGWWILLVMIILMATWLILKALKRAKQKKYQRKILGKFKSLEQKLKNDPSNATVAEINTLLRQLAITYYSRAEIASLTGGDWLHFLDESGDTQDFSRGAGRILIEAPYQLDRQLDKQINTPSEHHIENLNLNEFIPLIQNWAKRIVSGKRP
jgi:hypothetical protein